jgi:hypothetical protein
MTDRMSLSFAIKAANERLYALRREIGVSEKHLQDERADKSCNVSSLKHSISQLPNHLGWVSRSLTAQLRTQKQSVTVKTCLNLNEITSPTNEKVVNKTKDRTAVSNPSSIRHYPSLGIGALKTEHAPQFRVWLACRHLNSNGSGHLTQFTLKQQLTVKDAPLRLCGWRRLQQILHRGNGHFWTYNQQQKRVWLFGTVRVAKYLQVDSLEGQPVQLPVKALTGGIGLFKAHLYGAWHSGRNSHTQSAGKPISRQTQELLTQVPQRTQRHYEQQAGVQIIPNLAIGSAYTPANIEQQTWRKGGAVFQFVDKNGRIGKRNGRYVAWQMPNSYIGPHANAAPGNHRRLNRQLTGLVQKGVQGNDLLSPNHRYFHNGHAAATALTRQRTDESYWPLPVKQCYQLWSVFFEYA